MGGGQRSTSPLPCRGHGEGRPRPLSLVTSIPRRAARVRRSSLACHPFARRPPAPLQPLPPGVRWPRGPVRAAKVRDQRTERCVRNPGRAPGGRPRVAGEARADASRLKGPQGAAQVSVPATHAGWEARKRPSPPGGVLMKGTSARPPCLLQAREWSAV